MEITTKNGWLILIDEADLEAIRDYGWYVDPSTGYAAANIRLPNGKKRKVYMHRLLMGFTAGDGRFVDHLNRVRLDNRRANLREATRADNNRNVGVRADSSTGIRGVTHRNGRWIARRAVAGRMVNLGRFATAKEAEAAYRAAGA